MCVSFLYNKFFPVSSLQSFKECVRVVPLSAVFIYSFLTPETKKVPMLSSTKKLSLKPINRGRQKIMSLLSEFLLSLPVEIWHSSSFFSPLSLSLSLLLRISVGLQHVSPLLKNLKYSSHWYGEVVPHYYP